MEEAIEAIKGALADDSPTELKKLVLLTANVAADYKKTINDGVKKCGVEARKDLGEIKKLALEMRKLVLAARNPKEE